MKIVEKLDISENILQELINIARKKIKKIIVFDNRIYEEILRLKPEKIKNKNIIPIKKTKKICLRLGGYIYLGYDSLNESIVVICIYVSKNLYLLKGVRYKNKIYNIDENYYINNFIEHIIISILKK